MSQNIQYYHVDTTHPKYPVWLDAMKAQFSKVWPENIIGFNQAKGATEAIVAIDWGDAPEWTNVDLPDGLVIESFPYAAKDQVADKVNAANWKPDDVDPGK